MDHKITDDLLKHKFEVVYTAQVYDYAEKILHPHNQVLFEHWARLPRKHALPSFQELSFSHLSKLVPWIGLLESGASGKEYLWKMAGMGISSIFKKEVRGTSFFDLWGGFEKEVLMTILAKTIEKIPSVVRLSAIYEHGEGIGLEMVLVPVFDTEALKIDTLCTFVPFHDLHWVDEANLQHLELTSVKMILPTQKKEVSSTRNLGMRPMTAGRGHLRVIEGGRCG